MKISGDVKYILFNAGGKVKLWKDLGSLSILKAYWQKGYIFSRIQCCVLEKTEQNRLVNGTCKDHRRTRHTLKFTSFFPSFLSFLINVSYPRKLQHPNCIECCSRSKSSDQRVAACLSLMALPMCCFYECTSLKNTEGDEEEKHQKKHLFSFMPD